MEESRTEKDGGEHEGGYDAERKVIEFGQRRQQRRPLKMGLNEVVARPGSGASGRDGLRVEWRPGGRGRNWPCGFALCADRGNWCWRGRDGDKRWGRRGGHLRGRWCGGGRRGRSGHGAGIQTRGDFDDGPAEMGIALQAMTHNIQEKSG